MPDHLVLLGKVMILKELVSRVLSAEHLCRDEETQNLSQVLTKAMKLAQLVRLSEGFSGWRKVIVVEQVSPTEENELDLDLDWQLCEGEFFPADFTALQRRDRGFGEQFDFIFEDVKNRFALLVVSKFEPQLDHVQLDNKANVLAAVERAGWFVRLEQFVAHVTHQSQCLFKIAELRLRVVLVFVHVDLRIDVALIAFGVG